MNREATVEERTRVRLPELLAPAGDWDCAKAAVENGADGIYFGLERFNARMRARNFTAADLPKLLEFLHRRGVKGYVTFNTLVFENEMAEAEDYIRTFISAGVDAAIVQDVGMCRLIRKLSPDFPIHASTQMTITSAAGVAFARELGCNLVVLARECSLRELEKMLACGEGAVVPGQNAESSPGPPPAANAQSCLPIEVFVHGALCVAYSGQCLTSEALGGRSANRGECAQACRMPYELISDGQPVPLGDRKYLLSPQDLAGLPVLGELVRMGVASLKIEGRLKSPEYVANITRIYRQALDRLAAAAPELRSGSIDANTRYDMSKSRGKSENEGETSDAGTRYDMEMAFSRGLYTGWFGGTNNQELVHGRFGKKRGVYLGEVASVRRDGVMVRLEGPLKPGDGVVFDAGEPEKKEEGGRVYEIREGVNPERTSRLGKNGRPAGAGGIREARTSLLTFGRGGIDFDRIHAGDKVWKTSDPELDRRLRQSYQGEAPRFRRSVTMEAHGFADAPLTLIARDDLGCIASLDSGVPLVKADKHPLTTDLLRQQLGRLGGTPFELADVRNCLEGEVLLPISELNRLRREVVKRLEVQRVQPKPWTLHPEPAAEALTDAGNGSGGETAKPDLIVLVRNLAQLETAIKCGVATVYCDFEDPKKYRDAVASVRGTSQGAAKRTIFVAPPRIFKTGEEWTLKQVRSCEADGYLVRNYDHLAYFAEERRIGDYSLNIANRLTAEYFMREFGLERVTASYDLNFTQLEALLRSASAEWFEVTIHQHIPMFHMEHCVFCAFLSSGTDYTNCGRPCDKHEVRLRDRVGAEHPVKADAGCRNTVFNALAQTGADYVSRMLALGVRHFRLEFLNETPSQVAATIDRYERLLRGEITGQQIWRELKLLNQLGVTRGAIRG